MICANLDRLEIYVGGQHFATVTPDTANYGNLEYPPSFADFTAVDGSSGLSCALMATSARSRSRPARWPRTRPGTCCCWLRRRRDRRGWRGCHPAGVRAADRHGAPRPYVGGQVTLDVAGPALLIGDNPFDFAAAGGAGAVWIRSLPGSPGTVTVTATHPSLGRAVVRVRVGEVPGDRLVR